MLPMGGPTGRRTASASRKCRSVLCALVLLVVSHVAAAAAPDAQAGRASLALGLSDDGRTLSVDVIAEDVPLSVDPRINISLVTPGGLAVTLEVRQAGLPARRCVMYSPLRTAPVEVVPGEPMRLELEIAFMRYVFCLEEGAFELRAVLVDDGEPRASSGTVVYRVPEDEEGLVGLDEAVQVTAPARSREQVEALCHRRSNRALVAATEARILSRPEPRWPLDVATDGGCAVFTFRIDLEGRAVDIRTTFGSSARALSRSLRYALSGYRFAPAAAGQDDRGSLVLSMWLEDDAPSGPPEQAGAL